MCRLKPHRLSELWTDPTSGELSMSRLGLGVVVLFFIPANAALEVLGCHLNAWTFLIQVLGILAGIYGVNSAAGAWKRGSPGTKFSPDDPLS